MTMLMITDDDDGGDWLMLMPFRIAVYIKDLEVFATKTETNNEQQYQQQNQQPSVAATVSTSAPAAVLATSAASPPPPTSMPKAKDTFSAPQHPPASLVHQQHHDAALVALAQNPEQSLASTKEKSTPEKVSIPKI